jgi:hypothetical protein
MKEKLAEMEAEAKKLREVQAQVEKDLSTQSQIRCSERVAIGNSLCYRRSVCKQTRRRL